MYSEVPRAATTTNIDARMAAVAESATSSGWREPRESKDNRQRQEAGHNRCHYLRYAVWRGRDSSDDIPVQLPAIEWQKALQKRQRQR